MVEGSIDAAAAVYSFELGELLRKSSDHLRVAHILASFLGILTNGQRIELSRDLIGLSNLLRKLCINIDDILTQINLANSPIGPSNIN
jgi:hypothetical protein